MAQRDNAQLAGGHDCLPRQHQWHRRHDSANGSLRHRGYVDLVSFRRRVPCKVGRSDFHCRITPQWLNVHLDPLVHHRVLCQCAKPTANRRRNLQGRNRSDGMHAMRRKKLASCLWPRFSSSLYALNRNSQMFAAIRKYQREAVRKYANRAQMYSAINERRANWALSYLEFGVWRGESLELWSHINTNPASRFYGFDSFEGLP